MTKMIPSKSIETYDWVQDIRPVILENLNELLVKDGTEPLTNLYGGSFKDGKWVGVLDSNDYRNYWHVYVDLWGENLVNDSYQDVYFPHVDNDDEWDYWYERADQFSSESCNSYEHSDQYWARHIVTSVRKLLREHFTSVDEDGYRLVFWWSW